MKISLSVSHMILNNPKLSLFMGSSFRERAISALSKWISKVKLPDTADEWGDALELNTPEAMESVNYENSFY